MIFSLSACGGNVKNVNVIDVESEINTPDEINSAIETIKKEFGKDWKRCLCSEFLSTKLCTVCRIGKSIL